MLPIYSNALGVARNTNAAGQLTELQIDFLMRYTEAGVSPTEKGMVSVSAQRNEKVASILLTREGVYSLVSILRKTLGTEFDAIIEHCEAQE